jgi:hypothetical protein
MPEHSHLIRAEVLEVGARGFRSGGGVLEVGRGFRTRRVGWVRSGREGI